MQTNFTAQTDSRKKKKTRLISVPRIIFYALGFAVIIFITLALVFVLSSRKNNRIPFIFGRSVAWVMTDSMEPTIPARSYILIEKIEASQVTEDSVILFISDDPALEGSYNTHRVLEIIGDHEEFITKGDAAEEPDGYHVKADKVMAVYVKNMPFLTVFGRVLFTDIGVMIFIVAILVITMFLYLPDIIKLVKKKTEQNEAQKKQLIDDLVQKELERLRAEAAKKAEEGVNTGDGDNAGETP